jgi:uncharacterized repeat protein (TIGR01451 family)
MKEKEKEKDEPRREFLLVLLIVPLGVLCMFLTGQQAIKLTPSWTLVADIGSNLDPNTNFAAQTNPELMEPINANILTQPVWGGLFLTPNAIIPTRIIPTKVSTTVPQPQPTTIATTIPTDNPTPIPLPTNIVPPPPTKPPPPPTKPPPSPPPPPVPSADLAVSISADIAVYTPGAGIEYTILVNNAGPDNVAGFNISDTIPVAITGLTITCTPSDPVNDSCGTDTSAGQDVAFNGASLSAGQTLTITIQGAVGAGTVGDLLNKANLVIPGGAGFNDPDSSNNSDIENTLAPVRPDIGPPNGGFITIGDGNPAAFLLPTPIIASGDATPDFVYFEHVFDIVNSSVLLDWVQIEISTDQAIWYTVFFWGNCTPPDPPGPATGTCTADTNTNVNINVIGGYETDNRSFTLPTTVLYASLSAPAYHSGVTIDIDAIPGITTGTDYYWIRVTAPQIGGTYGGADGLDIDSIQPYYP